MAREKSVITKVAEQAKKSSGNLKKIEHDQVEMVINVAFLLFIQILVFKLFVGN